MTTSTQHTTGQVFLEFVGWSVFVFFVLYIAWVYGLIFDTLREPVML